MENQGPSYAQMAQVLGAAAHDMPVAEVHGFLSGLCCATEHVDSHAWINQVLPDDGTEVVAAARGACVALLSETLRQLNDVDCGYYLLMPDDALPLGIRTQALGEWCQGFVLGLSSGGVTAASALPEASAEILADIVGISGLSAQEQDSSEEDEVAYAELVEYVRMGALLIREELRALRQPRPGDATVH